MIVNSICGSYAEISKVQQSGRIPLKEQKYVDIYREKQIRVTVKVLVPVKEHPKVNYKNNWQSQAVESKRSSFCCTVQFRWEITWTEGQFNEKTARGDYV